MAGRRRTAAVLLLLALVASACGSRLNNAQHQLAVNAALGRGGGSGGGAAAGDQTSTGDNTASGDTSGSGGGTSGGTSGGASGGTSGGTSGGGGGGSTAGTTPAAPKGGNGGATDKGVTGTEIRIGVLSDVSGPVPGLFQSTVQAVNSWANMVNSQGGIFGRKIKVDVIDSKTDAGANRAGALQACGQDFALVGSMSAYDDGGAASIDQCGIPDLTAIPTNAPRGNEKNGFFAFPNVQQWYALGPKKYLADTFPDAPKTAAMIWLAANVTRSNATKNMEAGGTIGYQWVYTKEVQITEPNYAPYVVDMKNKNVQYVSMVGDANNESRLLQAMQQQNFKPKVREFDSVVYDPRFLAAAGSAAEGIVFALNIVPLEEASTSAEAQLYQKWLKATAGSAKPDYFGVYAWSAARMFQQALEQVGAEITRAKLISNLQALHSWDDHGMHAAQDVGGKKPTACFVMMTVQGGAFKRSYPASGFDCTRAPVYAVKSAG